MMKSDRQDDRAPMDGPRATESTFERVVAGLRASVARVRRIPTALYVVLFVSVASSTGLAYWWFWSRDSSFMKLASIPWLLLAAMPQLALWLVASTLRELFGIPERLWDFKESVLGQDGDIGHRLGRIEGATKPTKNIFRILRNAMVIRAEVAQLVAARVVFRRFAGTMAAVVAPFSLLGNSLIIAVGVIQMIAIAL